jgi:hypothetical protein
LRRAAAIESDSAWLLVPSCGPSSGCSCSLSVSSVSHTAKCTFCNAQ